MSKGYTLRNTKDEHIYIYFFHYSVGIKKTYKLEQNSTNLERMIKSELTKCLSSEYY